MNDKNTVDAEIIDEPADKLELAITEAGLEQSSAANLRTAFASYFQEADRLASAASEITVTSEDQREAMAEARKIRLALKAVRVEAEKTRKKLKEDSLRTGKAIDGVANVLKFLIVPTEDRLQEQEDFAERAAQARREAIAAERGAKLASLDVDPTHYNLGDMTPEGYAQLVAGIEAATAARIAAEKKAEEDRIEAEAKAKAEREAAEAAERERVAAQAAENARLKAEAQKREKELEIERAKARAEAEARAKIEAERAKAQKEADAERAKLAKIEAEAKAKADAEAKAKAAAEKAPDKAKLLELAWLLTALEIPKMTTNPGKAIRDRVVSILAAAANQIEDIAASL